MADEDEKIKATLIYHLRRKNVIGGAHTNFETLKRGFPGHLGKDVLGIAKELVKEGLLLTKPASYGLQVMLNKERINEIDDFIAKTLGFRF